jgi:hypothetical protein
MRQSRPKASCVSAIDSCDGSAPLPHGGSWTIPLRRNMRSTANICDGCHPSRSCSAVEPVSPIAATCSSRPRKIFRSAGATTSSNTGPMNIPPTTTVAKGRAPDRRSRGRSPPEKARHRRKVRSSASAASFVRRHETPLRRHPCPRRGVRQGQLRSSRAALPQLSPRQPNGT